MSVKTENITIEDLIEKVSSYDDNLEDIKLIRNAYDYAYKKHFSQKPVWEWDDPKIKLRQPDAIRFYSDVLSDDIEFYYFIQYFFFKQCVQCSIPEE